VFRQTKWCQAPFSPFSALYPPYAIKERQKNMLGMALVEQQKPCLGPTAAPSLNSRRVRSRVSAVLYQYYNSIFFCLSIKSLHKMGKNPLEYKSI